MQQMLKVEDLSTGYGHMAVVHGVSLQAAAGQVTAVLGPNGAGKSTLLRCIAGQLPLIAGSITIDDESISGTASHVLAQRGLRLVPQGFDTFDNLTVYDNLTVGSSIRERHLRRDAVEAQLTNFPSLRERARVSAGSLSGGERAQLSIARALVASPKVLLLDEVTTGLSPAAINGVLEVLGKIAGEGVTVLLIEQNIHAAMTLASYVYVMVEGRIGVEGDPQIVGGRIVETYFGHASTAAISSDVDAGVE